MAQTLPLRVQSTFVRVHVVTHSHLEPRQEGNMYMGVGQSRAQTIPSTTKTKSLPGSYTGLGL